MNLISISWVLRFSIKLEKLIFSQSWKMKRSRMKVKKTSPCLFKKWEKCFTRKDGKATSGKQDHKASIKEIRKCVLFIIVRREDTSLHFPLASSNYLQEITQEEDHGGHMGWLRNWIRRKNWHRKHFLHGKRRWCNQGNNWRLSWWWSFNRWSS